MRNIRVCVTLQSLQGPKYASSDANLIHFTLIYGNWVWRKWVCFTAGIGFLYPHCCKRNWGSFYYTLWNWVYFTLLHGNWVYFTLLYEKWVFLVIIWKLGLFHTIVRKIVKSKMYQSFLRRTKITSFSATIKSRREQLLGYVLQMPDDPLPKVALNLRPKRGKISRGRPKKALRSTIIKISGTVKLISIKLQNWQKTERNGMGTWE